MRRTVSIGIVLAEMGGVSSPTGAVGTSLSQEWEHDRLKARLASVMRSIRAGEHGSIVARRCVEWRRPGWPERALVMMPAGPVTMLRSCPPVVQYDLSVAPVVPALDARRRSCPTKELSRRGSGSGEEA